MAELPRPSAYHFASKHASAHLAADIVKIPHSTTPKWRVEIWQPGDAAWHPGVLRIHPNRLVFTPSEKETSSTYLFFFSSKKEVHALQLNLLNDISKATTAKQHVGMGKDGSDGNLYRQFVVHPRAYGGRHRFRASDIAEAKKILTMLEKAQRALVTSKVVEQRRMSVQKIGDILSASTADWIEAVDHLQPLGWMIQRTRLFPRLYEPRRAYFYHADGHLMMARPDQAEGCVDKTSFFVCKKTRVTALTKSDYPAKTDADMVFGHLWLQGVLISTNGSHIDATMGDLYLHCPLKQSFRKMINCLHSAKAKLVSPVRPVLSKDFHHSPTIVKAQSGLLLGGDAESDAAKELPVLWEPRWDHAVQEAARLFTIELASSGTLPDQLKSPPLQLKPFASENGSMTSDSVGGDARSRTLKAMGSACLGHMFVDGIGRRRLILRSNGKSLQMFRPESFFLASIQDAASWPSPSESFELGPHATVLCSPQGLCNPSEPLIELTVKAPSLFGSVVKRLKLRSECGLEQICSFLTLLRRYHAAHIGTLGQVMLNGALEQPIPFIKTAKKFISPGPLHSRQTTVILASTQKGKAGWVELERVLSSRHIEQLRQKIQHEFHSLGFREAYLSFALVVSEKEGKITKTKARKNVFARASLAKSFALAMSRDGAVPSHGLGMHRDRVVEVSSTELVEPSLEDIDHDRSSAQDAKEINVCDRIAVFVLGPSAAGKTFTTQTNLQHVLRTNHMDDSDGGTAFVSVDGGITRDVSVMWRYLKAMPQQLNATGACKFDTPISGFTNLFNCYFKSSSEKFKDRLFETLVKKGVNMIIGDTAADYIPALSEGRIGHMLRTLKACGYTVIMTMVHASLSKCINNGHKREKIEGKRYSSRAWEWSIRNSVALFNLARKLGFVDQSFFLFDNTDWNKPRMLEQHPGQGLKVDIKAEKGAEHMLQPVFHECDLNDIAFR